MVISECACACACAGKLESWSQEIRSMVDFFVLTFPFPLFVVFVLSFAFGWVVNLYGIDGILRLALWVDEGGYLIDG